MNDSSVNPVQQLTAVSPGLPLPASVSAAGQKASYRFLEFFTARIRNPHTRRSYGRAVGDFCAWLEARGLRDITQVNSFVV
ncbi:MAG TPA: hypothetical protein PKW21_11660, partial [Rhabdaerophilum sp.]|nr:hypothetical protein [Rhabdaerophilum sp.]